MAAHTELTRPKPPTASRCASSSTRTLTAPTAATQKGKRRSSPKTLASRSTWTAKAASRHTCLEEREALAPVFDDLNRYEATTHFNGQSTVTIDGSRATGESYTIAHHLYTEDGNRKIMIASLRYLDTFAKIDHSWYFAERKLILDWSETRSLGTEEES